MCRYHNGPSFSCYCFCHRLLNTYKAGITSTYQMWCLSGVWSGTTLRRVSVQLSKPSDATHCARPMVQSGCGCRLPQPGQLTTRDDLPGYHNNNNLRIYLDSMSSNSRWLTVIMPWRRNLSNVSIFKMLLARIARRLETCLCSLSLQIRFCL